MALPGLRGTRRLTFFFSLDGFCSAELSTHRFHQEIQAPPRMGHWDWVQSDWYWVKLDWFPSKMAGTQPCGLGDNFARKTDHGQCADSWFRTMTVYVVTHHGGLNSPKLRWTGAPVPMRRCVPTPRSYRLKRTSRNWQKLDYETNTGDHLDFTT